MIKKIVKNIPFISIILMIMMWVGYKGSSNGEFVFRFDWIDKGDQFRWRDIKAQFGHADREHIFLNMSGYLMFGLASEFLMKKWKFTLWVLGIIAVNFGITEVMQSFERQNDALGASGWLMALPGLLLFATAKKIQQNEDLQGAMFLPIAIFVGATMMAATDYSLMGTQEGGGVDHLAHLVGYALGALIALLPVRLYVSMIRETINEMKYSWRNDNMRRHLDAQRWMSDYQAGKVNLAKKDIRRFERILAKK